MLVFRVRLSLALLATTAIVALAMSFGIRWHTYRARASLYARQEVEHTFEAAHYARVARVSGGSDEEVAEAAGFRKLAEMHEKAAQECTRLREFYETSW